MKIKKLIATGLLGVTMMGALAAMPAVKIGNQTIGTETVSAWDGSYIRTWYYHERGRGRLSGHVRLVTVHNVYNRRGQLIRTYNTYGRLRGPVG